MGPDLLRDFAPEVCVVGAGPVGSFLALRLGAAGLRTHLIERRAQPPARSMAIGVMPPTLRRMAALGLDAELSLAGIRVRRAVAHDERQVLGFLDFSSLPPPHNYVLSLPQGALVSALWRRLRGEPSVVFETDCTVEDIALDRWGAAVRKIASDGTARLLRCQFLALCDGARGRLRTRLGPDSFARPYGPRFVMGDAPDAADWGDEAHLFFTPFGSLESFPLPDGRRRWVALMRPGDPEAPAAALDERIRRLTGAPGRAGDWIETSRFAPERRLAPRYFHGRAILCGDAAHVMSPIGGQGMNTGLGDAARLAEALIAILRAGADAETELRRYQRERRRVFLRAAARAARGMWLGTRTGRGASALRSALIRFLLGAPARQSSLARYFSMWSLPDAAPLLERDSSPWKEAPA